MTDKSLTKHINTAVKNRGFLEVHEDTLILDGYFTIEELKSIVEEYESKRPPV